MMMNFATTSQEDETPARQLRRVWINETFSPELLPYENNLLQTIMKQLDEQVRIKSYKHHRDCSGDYPSVIETIVLESIHLLLAIFDLYIRTH
jgi:hypothetical protein